MTYRLVQSRPDTVVLRYEHGDAEGFCDADRATRGAGHGRRAPWRGDTVVQPHGRHGVAWETGPFRGVARAYETEVTIGAVACAQLGLGAAVPAAARLAARFGHVTSERVSRLDLCADIAGLSPDDVHADEWVVRGHPRRLKTRQRIVEGRKGGKGPKGDPELLTEWHTADGCHTGWTVAPGAAIKANLYDKRRELRRPESAHKRAMEEEAWRARGWTGRGPVARLEFQMRTQALRELECDDPYAMALDGAWGYCTQRWARIIDAGSHARRDRADIHPAWRLARTARFDGAGTVSERHRVHAGPTAANTLGTLRSMLASRGRLPEVADVEAYAAAAAQLIREELGAQLDSESDYLRGHHEVARARYMSGFDAKS